MKFLEKKVIVTGAASGIGRAIATRFAEEGATVACLDQNVDALDATVQELLQAGHRAFGLRVDIGLAMDAATAADAAIAQMAGVDILVNNAGVNSVGTVQELDTEQWNRLLAVNLTSMFVMTKAVWSRFASQGHGVILNMSSIMGLTPVANNVAYCTSKAAIVGFTKSLAADGGPLGIRVNCVCPGYVHTPIMDRAHSAEFQQKIVAQLPMKRMATPREIANGFLYLASDDASYATGTVLLLDGAASAGFAGCFITK